MQIQIEIILLVLSFLFFLSVFAGKASSKFGVPSLLLFLGVGMLAGSDGLGVEFDDIYMAQAIGTVALCIILFSGGMDTKVNEIKPVLVQGVLLSTFGVLITALIMGLLIWWVLGATMASAGIGFMTSLLLASIMSSTDSASVFSILRSKNLNLKQNLRPMLELESGSNDPMAYLLVLTLVDIISLGSTPSILVIIGKLIPAGTGAKEYMDIGYSLEKEFFDDEPSEVLEDEFMEGEINAVFIEHFSWAMKIGVISNYEKEKYAKKFMQSNNLICREDIIKEMDFIF